ncbi:unnamed protein product [Hyaloperonospora brassicae]|uniref:SUN domain-containing protein n=1 Tax=Hyaloperonospora brassicae TaxID=162125 RepID=A0AAV0T814_HYABA|nr:unnamed protein product [Hyaloperonospora brassicae]
MADGNAYSRRLRSFRRSDAALSEEGEELENITGGSCRQYVVNASEPVQRALELRSGDDCEDEDEEDDEFSDFEEPDDDFMGPVYRSTAYIPPYVGKEDMTESEGVQEEEEESDFAHAVQRSELKMRAAGAAAYLQIPRRAGGLWQELVVESKAAKTVLKGLRRLWRLVLRNSFMAVNVLWLLAPLCCFAIAISVPQYLKSAIEYVDVFSMSGTGARGSSAHAGVEGETMRSMVQQVVDSQLLGMSEEMKLLRLHSGSDSIIAAHIEKAVAQRTEGLWERFSESTVQLQQDLHVAREQQAKLLSVVKEQEEKMNSMQDKMIQRTAASRSDAENEYAREREMRRELVEWRDTFKRELESEIQSRMQGAESRMSRVLQEEKEALSSSADALRSLDATDPGILRVIEVAFQAVEIKKTGRVDHAALANGASVIHSERDLLYQDRLSPAQLLIQLLGPRNSEDDGRFTSPSYRRAPAPFLGLLLSSSEIPWWLSRHNGRPETALSETMEIGSCWGIAGPSGRLSVKFAQQIVADSITIDHIPAQIASDFSSAPNEFRVLGILGHPLRETVDFIFFGNFSYASKGSASQTFKLASSQSQHSAIDGIVLDVLSNHGHPDYTCLYRFRVHGQPV